MIKLGPRPPEPPYLSGATVTRTKQQLADKVRAGEKLKSKDFPSHWLDDSVKNPLWEIHHGKCCYCERKREIKRESDVEHYRPKLKVTEENNHLGYWWLAYEWTNYLYSCKICNETYKRNFFPLLDDSPRASQPGDDISRERPVLINPIDDDPESCITYDWWSGGKKYVKASGTDENGRGSETIKILGLNHLMEERAENLSLLKNLSESMIFAKRQNNQPMIQEFAADIRSQTSSKKTFAGFRRAYFRAMGLGNYVAP